jgi:hypothetical protein
MQLEKALIKQTRLNLSRLEGRILDIVWTSYSSSVAIPPDVLEAMRLRVPPLKAIVDARAVLLLCERGGGDSIDATELRAIAGGLIWSSHTIIKAYDGQSQSGRDALHEVVTSLHKVATAIDNSPR